MSGKVWTTWISDDIRTCPEKKVWNSVSGKYRTSLHLVKGHKWVRRPAYDVKVTVAFRVFGKSIFKKSSKNMVKINGKSQVTCVKINTLLYFPVYTFNNQQYCKLDKDIKGYECLYVARLFQRVPNARPLYKIINSSICTGLFHRNWNIIN